MQYIYLDDKRWEVLKLSYRIFDGAGVEEGMGIIKHRFTEQ